ncbi:MAG: aspartate 1-decarboxylase, partial [Thermoanaerobaculia bacterium]
MIRFFLRSKIHGATVTEANLHYEGSITIDAHLMHAAGLLPFEKVEIYDVTNGNRFATYVIEGEAGSGKIGLNGAAAHMVTVGDRVIIAAYGMLHEGQIANHRPRLVFAGEGNAIKEIREAETASTIA